MSLRLVSLDDLTIEDEEALASVPLYPRLKEALRAAGHRFLVPARRTELSWDRALFLNLTYWSGAVAADILCQQSLPADVVTHVAWHRVVAQGLAKSAAADAKESMLFGEAVASAFDLYLVGQLLHEAPESDFITTQVPAMGEAAANAGLSESEFGLLLEGVADDPSAAFSELRTLLFEASTALVPCADPLSAYGVLEGFASHRFAPLLHHYELSNWVLYTRAYGGGAKADETVRALHTELAAAPDALAWLVDRWL